MALPPPTYLVPCSGCIIITPPLDASALEAPAASPLLLRTRGRHPLFPAPRPPFQRLPPVWPPPLPGKCTPPILRECSAFSSGGHPATATDIEGNQRGDRSERKRAQQQVHYDINPPTPPPPVSRPHLGPTRILAGTTAPSRNWSPFGGRNRASTRSARSHCSGGSCSDLRKNATCPRRRPWTSVLAYFETAKHLGRPGRWTLWARSICRPFSATRLLLTILASSRQIVRCRGSISLALHLWDHLLCTCGPRCLYFGRGLGRPCLQFAFDVVGVWPVHRRHRCCRHVPRPPVLAEGGLGHGATPVPGRTPAASSYYLEARCTWVDDVDPYHRASGVFGCGGRIWRRSGVSILPPCTTRSIFSGIILRHRCRSLHHLMSLRIAALRDFA